ncbi:MAG: polysaccharide pyruvyl transferase CsaB [Firmicutes bacterium]|nr:polysaccharide pyruvyl transferase CsaB [Bacillota bacterium]
MAVKKILLSGYYGFGNAGDEAVLAALVQLLGDNLADVGDLEIVALSAKPEQTAAELGIRAINRWDKKTLRKELADAALFCSGGGSLLQDVTSVRSVYYYTSLLRMAQRQGVPTMVLAQGLGPLKTPLGRMLTVKTLKHCKLLTWRDADSVKLAGELGLADVPTYQVCDPVLLWRPQNGDSDGPTARIHPKRVALALRPWSDLKIEEAVRLVHLLREAGKEVVLLPFYCGEGGHGEDERLAEEINRRLGRNVPKVEICRCKTPADAMREISSVGFLVGMRLHSLIMAAAQQVPALAISYDPKVTSFAQMLNIPLVQGGSAFAADSVAAQIMAYGKERPADHSEEFAELWRPVLPQIKQLLAAK